VTATLGRCRARDLPELLRFIDDHWKRGHLFTTHRPLLDWQHREADGSYSFILARRDADGDIVGILGFLPTRRFDPALADANTVWLTMWKVRDDAGDAGLGLRLLRYLSEVEPHVAIGAITPNAATLPIYATLGYRTGELRHYVRLKDTTVVSGLSRTDAETRGDFSPPAKSATYLERRYLRHLVYRYDVTPIGPAHAAIAFLVTRVAEHEGHRALRIVDFVGPPESFAASGPVLQRLIEDHRADYADVYNAGFDASVFARAGFTIVDPDGPIVVPDHFEPYEHRNVRLWFALKAAAPPILFKGDADQDRPSQVTL